jgi:hypothetical protein
MPDTSKVEVQHLSNKRAEGEKMQQIDCICIVLVYLVLEHMGLKFNVVIAPLNVEIL